MEGDRPWSRQPGNAVNRDDNCRYTTVRKYHCATHRENDEDAPVQRCEKTVQVLRMCADRPAEVVESKTEYTEGDVPLEMIQGSRIDRDLGSHEWPSRSFEGGRDMVSRSLFGGFEELVQAAEELAQDFVGRFASSYEDRQTGPRVTSPLERFPGFLGDNGSSRRPTADSSPAGGSSGKAPNFSDFSGGCQEV